MNRAGGTSAPRAAAGRAPARATVTGLGYGTASVGLSLAAHLAAGGQLPSPVAMLGLLVVAVGAFSVASTRLTRRTHRVRLVALLVLAQPLLHGAFSTGGGAGGAGHLHGTAAQTPTTAADGSMIELMIVAHVQAAALTACLLAYGATVRAQLIEWLNVMPIGGGASLIVCWEPADLVGRACGSSMLEDVVATCAPRRGPPRRTAATVR
ncbi:MAG: hypothetical protein ACRDQ0_11095 [Pseudonocardia sp.]